VPTEERSTYKFTLLNFLLHHVDLIQALLLSESPLTARCKAPAFRFMTTCKCRWTRTSHNRQTRRREIWLPNVPRRGGKGLTASHQTNRKGGMQLRYVYMNRGTQQSTWTKLQTPELPSPCMFTPSTANTLERHDKPLNITQRKSKCVLNDP
jgi:hypothetical protein